MGRGAGGQEHSAPFLLHCHHAVPQTHQDRCWSREWPQAPIVKCARDAEAVPVGVSEAAGLGSSTSKVYEG